MFNALLLTSLVFAADRSQKSFWRDSNCYEWWKSTGSSFGVGKECEKACDLLDAKGKGPIATHQCTSACDELCLDGEVSKVSSYLIDLYPNLTLLERKLAKNRPVEAAHAYALSIKAENICLRLFKDSATNDESDACRHFAWAALLHKEFGSKIALDYLDAHESEPTQRAAEKEMDVYNNKRGIEYSELMKKKFTDDDLIKEFEILNKGGKFKIIKPNTKAQK